VLDRAGASAGTCFQVAAGVVVTAWHVGRDAGAGAVGDEVCVDPLAGGEKVRGWVVAVSEVCDVAVLRLDGALAASVSGLVRAAAVRAHSPVTITGVPELVDVHRFGFTHATARWLGVAVGEDGVARGQVEAAAVVRGMSGAPVRRAVDDRVVGVLSARYNTPSECMRYTVWAACVDDVLPLLPPGLSPRCRGRVAGGWCHRPGRHRSRLCQLPA
jgi:S1-C subfamily serine protease